MSDRLPAGPVTRGVDGATPPATLAGELPMGIVEAAAPALTDGALSRLRLTQARELVVNVGGSSGTSKVDEATPSSVGATITTTGQLVAAGAGVRYTGFAAEETSGAVGATAKIVLYNGTTNADPWMGTITLTSGQAGGGGPPDELDASAGVYAEITVAGGGACRIVPFSKVVA